MFDDTTTSYKHLFFQALLDSYRDGGFAETRFTLKALAVGMLEAAWYPSKVFRLTFGDQDQIGGLLSDVHVSENVTSSSKFLKAALGSLSKEHDRIMRYVPFRILTPFFDQQLQGVHDSQKQAHIYALSSKLYHTVRPLYKFIAPNEIEVHPDWAMYIAENFPIVSAWAERHWIAYLQSRNPTVPAISEKTRKPLQRSSLSAQTLYWRKAIKESNQEIRCIYSGCTLDDLSFHLDHFLPWTFVCHDAIWNLVPVVPAANLAKHDSLPDRSYLSTVAIIQHKGLMTAHRTMTKIEWKRFINSFVNDLRISEDAILHYDQFEHAYELSVGAQLNIAQAMGFKPNWRYTQQNAFDAL